MLELFMCVAGITLIFADLISSHLTSSSSSFLSRVYVSCIGSSLNSFEDYFGLISYSKGSFCFAEWTDSGSGSCKGSLKVAETTFWSESN